MRFVLIFFSLLFLLVGLPLSGVYLWSNQDLSLYLKFPPETFYVEQASFSWPIFFGLIIFLILVLYVFFLWPLRPCIKKKHNRIINNRSLPWWGYLGIFWGLIFWLLAWTRFDWFAAGQNFTFSLLWLAYILVINALTYVRSGRCMLINQTGYFLLLFPISSVFWWFFEFLNRFVQNWYYINIESFSAGLYVIHATICFSTVLPAVLSTRDFLLTFPILKNGYRSFFKISPKSPRLLSILILIVFGLGLACIGLYPDYLFSLLWLSPLFIIISVQTLTGGKHLFSQIKDGDWTQVMVPAIAALICGFFWEMWNYYSLVKWVYNIPYVQRFYLFEMPILGYSGYLPFGLECAVIGDLVGQSFQSLKTQ